ncbi:hypothetical protein J132_01045 [Termitomyces sp. J132]|nr:hypothetical protein J132_01045 [Termitomyces sp. J132]
MKIGPLQGGQREGAPATHDKGKWRASPLLEVGPSKQAWGKLAMAGPPSPTVYSLTSGALVEQSAGESWSIAEALLRCQAEELERLLATCGEERDGLQRKLDKAQCHDLFPETPHIVHQTPEPPKGPPTLRRTSAHAPRLLRLTPTPPRLTPTAPWPTSVPAPQPLTLNVTYGLIVSFLCFVFRIPVSRLPVLSCPLFVIVLVTVSYLHSNLLLFHIVLSDAVSVTPSDHCAQVFINPNNLTNSAITITNPDTPLPGPNLTLRSVPDSISSK